MEEARQMTPQPPWDPRQLTKSIIDRDPTPEEQGVIRTCAEVRIESGMGTKSDVRRPLWIMGSGAKYRASLCCNLFL